MPLTLLNTSGTGNFTLVNNSNSGNFSLLGVTPSIQPVESGLLIYLDTSNTTSYPGSGTTWYDLSGNNNNATLFNTPTYSSNFGGYLNFTDTNLEYATIPNIGDLSNWTIEAWFRLTTSLSGKVTSLITNQYNLATKLNYSLGTNNAPSSYNLVAGYFNGAWRNTTGIAPSTGIWYQAAGTYDGSVIRQYINGGASGGTLNYVGTSQSGGEIRLMRRWDDSLLSSNLVNGDLAIVRIYNRSLSSTEISQNYNADKAKYGL